MPFKYRNDEYNELADEFNIEFLRRSELKDLLAFCRAYKGKRINVSFPDGLDVDVAAAASDAHPDLCVRLDVTGLASVQELSRQNVRFFFDSSLPAYSFTLLHSLIEMGVSDVYLSDDLCYQMGEVDAICRKAGVRIRCVLNRIPSSMVGAGGDPRSMMYLPQDMPLLRQEYDTFEFDCGDPPDWHKLGVLYRTYFLQGRWHGELAEILPDLDPKLGLNDDFIYDGFGSRKQTCGLRCRSTGWSECRRCELLLQLMQDMHDKGIYYKESEEDDVSVRNQDEHGGDDR